MVCFVPYDVSGLRSAKIHLRPWLFLLCSHIDRKMGVVHALRRVKLLDLAAHMMMLVGRY